MGLKTVAWQLIKVLMNCSQGKSEIILIVVDRDHSKSTRNQQRLVHSIITSLTNENKVEYHASNQVGKPNKSPTKKEFEI